MNTPAFKSPSIRWRGRKFLTIVILLYFVLFLADPQAVEAALLKTAKALAQIAPILLIVVFFTALLNRHLRPQALAKHLGHESGLRGWLIALSAGILSHGPMYAWYPMIEDLKKHGLRDGLVVTFFYARSIKIPLLPLMVAYFGLGFTVLLGLYTVVASLLQGLILDRLCGRCDEGKERNDD
ncbi:permease [Nitratifractor sp.]